jgi:hypothetical protein
VKTIPEKAPLARRFIVCLIEFKNGVIDDLKNYEIKVKIFETLLILTERLGKTIQFTRNYVTFILNR